MLKDLAAILVLLSSFNAMGDWTVQHRVDPMSEEEKKMAVVENELGHKFYIYRLFSSGAAWGYFSIEPVESDSLDKNKPPLYIVDQNEPFDLTQVKRVTDMGIGLKAYEWRPKSVSFLMWHGDQNQGIALDLVKLMEGEKVVFRYNLSNGDSKEAIFTLRGAGQAISEVLEINQSIDHEALEKIRILNRALIDWTRSCRQATQNDFACFKKAKDCRKDFGDDINKIKACLQ